MRRNGRSLICTGILGNDDRPYLLSYSWTDQKSIIIYNEINKTNIAGVESEDTVLGLMVRTQDQTGVNVRDIDVNISRSGPESMQGWKDYIKISGVTKQYAVTIFLNKKMSSNLGMKGH